METHFDLTSVKQQVWSEIRQAMKMSNNTDSFWDNVQAFAHAVDWQEPWLRGLLVMHAVLFLSVLLFRRCTTYLGTVFFALGTIIYFGERINALAADHWTKFATQNYFDSHGIFYSVVVSGPAVVNLFAVLIFYLLEVTKLMVIVKKKELVMKARQRAKEESAAEGTAGNTKKTQ